MDQFKTNDSKLIINTSDNDYKFILLQRQIDKLKKEIELLKSKTT